MDIAQLSRIVFKDKHTFNTIDDLEKERLSFQFNRIMARNLVIHADALNKKCIPKSKIIDTWFMYSKNTTKTPDWFYVNWSKLRKEKEKTFNENIDQIDKYILSFYNDADLDLNEEPQKNIVEVIKKKKKKA